MAQVWCDLLFAHYPIPVEDLRQIVPPAFELDLWQGQAWLAVVPFRMEGIRPRGLFSVPTLSETPELNVRTYVSVGGRPGVYFFSLDAANVVAVRIARRFFHLPYFKAEMQLQYKGDMIHYRSRRTDPASASAEFQGLYRPVGEIRHASPGTLEHWLTERYCFYTLDRRQAIVRGDIHHKPWPLQPAEAEIAVNTMTKPLGLTLPDTPPLLHFARRVEVVAWAVECVGSYSSTAPPAPASSPASGNAL